jgi:hypothetical protein
MAAVNQILQSRSVSGGHAIELDFRFDDGSQLTLEILFQILPILMRSIWEAAAIAETTQRRAAGEQMMAFVVPYRMQDMRTGRSPDNVIVADFRTDLGPVQIAMTPEQTRLTIERLTAELGRLGMQFPKLS